MPSGGICHDNGVSPISLIDSLSDLLLPVLTANLFSFNGRCYLYSDRERQWVVPWL